MTEKQNPFNEFFGAGFSASQPGLRWFPDTLRSIAVHNFARHNRSALVITETEFKLVAVPAIMGLSSNVMQRFRKVAVVSNPI